MSGSAPPLPPPGQPVPRAGDAPAMRRRGSWATWNHVYFGVAACLAVPVAALAARKALMDEEREAREAEEAWGGRRGHEGGWGSWGGGARWGAGHLPPRVRGILDPSEAEAEAEAGRRAAAPKSVTEASESGGDIPPPLGGDGGGGEAEVMADAEADTESVADAEADTEAAAEADADAETDAGADAEAMAEAEEEKMAKEEEGRGEGEAPGAGAADGGGQGDDRVFPDPPEPEPNDVFRVLSELQTLSRRMNFEAGGETAEELEQLVRLLASGVFQLSRSKDEELERAVAAERVRGQVELTTAAGALEAEVAQARQDAEVARHISAQAGDECEAARVSAQMAIEMAESSVEWRVEAAAEEAAAERAQERVRDGLAAEAERRDLGSVVDALAVAFAERGAGERRAHHAALLAVACHTLEDALHRGVPFLGLESFLRGLAASSKTAGPAWDRSGNEILVGALEILPAGVSSEGVPPLGALALGLAEAREAAHSVELVPHLAAKLAQTPLVDPATGEAMGRRSVTWAAKAVAALRPLPHVDPNIIQRGGHASENLSAGERLAWAQAHANAGRLADALLEVERAAAENASVAATTAVWRDMAKRRLETELALDIIRTHALCLAARGLVPVPHLQED